MTVAELIAKLSEFPPDMPVVVSGFDELGYDDIATVEQIRIFRAYPDRDFYELDNRSGRLSYPQGGESFEAVHVNF